MAKFWELFEQSIIMQSALTLMIVSTYLYMIIAGHPVPQLLTDLLGLVLGFFFGSKVAGAQKQRQIDVLKKELK